MSENKPDKTPLEDHESRKHVDEVSGVETTGHSWDGLRELNNPLPRWWVWIFLITIIWSIGYFIIYPAWPVPGGATEGVIGYTQYKELEDSQREIRTRQQAYLEDFEGASYEEILNDAELYNFAVSGGAAAFKENCAACHGTGAQGGKGYPNLNDDDWLWGGQLDEIHQTLLYGIRTDSLDSRMSLMPAFGKDEILEKDEINAVVDYVLSFSAGDHDTTRVSEGRIIFQKQCATCHGNDAKGDQSKGAPNLTDKIWLYGGDRETVYDTVYYARSGMMPSWGNRLDENTIRQLTIYLHQLGGVEESEAEAEQDGDVLELPDKGLYDDAPPESPEYEKTQNLPSGEEAVAPQPEAPVAREETEQETAVSDEREPDKD